MLTVLLLVALCAVLVLLFVRRRHVTVLTSVACLLGAILMLIWMQDTGLWPGTDGPLSHLRPRTPADLPR